jgi:hypothetical protein
MVDSRTQVITNGELTMAGADLHRAAAVGVFIIVLTAEVWPVSLAPAGMVAQGPIGVRSHVEVSKKGGKSFGMFSIVARNPTPNLESVSPETLTASLYVSKEYRVKRFKAKTLVLAGAYFRCLASSYGYETYKRELCPSSGYVMPLVPLDGSPDKLRSVNLFGIRQVELIKAKFQAANGQNQTRIEAHATLNSGDVVVGQKTTASGGSLDWSVCGKEDPPSRDHLVTCVELLDGVIIKVKPVS